VLTTEWGPDEAPRGAPLDDERTGNANELKVLLADDHGAARAGIKGAIEPHGLRVVAEASNAGDALRMAIAQRPDICVLAVALPGNGIEAARQIKRSLPATKIVMMTGAANDEELFGALRAGADGYLLMSTSAGRLPHAFRGVARGEAALPRAMTARLILEFRERGTKRRLILPGIDGDVELTARQFEVLERFRKRERTAEIAARLDISEVTVRRHIASVLRKLGMPNRRSAIEMLEQAERQGLPNAGPADLDQPS
jgi:DNA-binding NarL/FixJ family response regulator